MRLLPAAPVLSLSTLTLAGLLALGLATPAQAATATGAAAAAAPHGGEEPFDVAAHYTKYEFRIPMRDGARLFTVVYVPKDSSRPVPFLMTRTPYSVATGGRGVPPHYGVDFLPGALGPSEAFAKAGYIFVNQDVRGRFKSDGQWTEMQPHLDVKKGPKDVDASTDMHDTVEWLLKNVPGNNGRVGIWGISYPGFYTAASIIDSHPAIKAASPQAPVTDLYMNDDSYHNGAFMLTANYGFYTFFKPQANPVDKLPRYEPFDYGTTSGYDYFLQLGTLQRIRDSLPAEARDYFWANAGRPTYDDWWQARNIAPHLKNVRAAVLTVGGWFDAEDPQGPLTTFHAIDRLNPGADNHLVMGPWVHGGWGRRDGARLGPVSFGAATGKYFQQEIFFPFFERHLRPDDAPAGKAGKAGAGAGAAPAPEAFAKATVFETGTNVWRRFDAWPPKASVARTLYLQSGGVLSFDPPAAAAGTAAFDAYTSDPAHPVPFVPYPTLDMPQSYMVGDQRFAATRPDVLVYQTAPLEQDLTVAGPVLPRLVVSSSGTDSDFVVKLIDVYPAAYPDAASDEDEDEDAPRKHKANDVVLPPVPMGGYQMLVRGEPMRARYRHSFVKPEALVPDAPTPLNFSMPDVAHTFRRGHRIMVQIQSSWFPLTDRNPQRFVDIPSAKPEDFQAAVQRVFHSAAQPSGIELRVLPGLGQ